MERTKSSLLCLSFLVIAITSEARIKKVKLQDALTQKLVSMKATSLGSFQGECMEMSLKNLNPDSLEITVEPGYKLNSEKDELQDILLIKEAIFVLRKGEEKKQKVVGFCCQNHNLCPKQGAKYNEKAKQDERLKQLAKYLSKSKFNDNVVQQSIWSISDSLQTASVGEACLDSQFLKLRTLISNIKGEPVPDYTILQKTYVAPSGRIYISNVAVKGNMTFENSKYQYCYFRVFDASNQQVSSEIGQWLDTGNQKPYEFYVPATQLSKGIYTLKLTAESGEQLGEKKISL